jgi:hypothetical protein
MRLTPSQISSIKQVATAVMGDQARLLLFGSRTDDTRRGGDIDLYVAQPVLSQQEQLATKLKFLVMLKQQIGEQRVDLVFAPAPGQPMWPIHAIAQQTGIPL